MTFHTHPLDPDTPDRMEECEGCGSIELPWDVEWVDDEPFCVECAEEIKILAEMIEDDEDTP